MKTLTTILVIVALASVGNADPRYWGAAGVALSQRSEVEWGSTSASNSMGFAVTAWSDLHAGNREVYTQLVSPSGELMWGTGVRLTEDSHEQSLPKIVASDNGWIAVWVDYRDVPRGDPQHWLAGGGELWVQKLNDQGQPLWGANGLPVPNSEVIDRGSLQLLSDGAGGAMLAWGGYVDGWQPNLYVERVTATGSIAWPRVMVDRHHSPVGAVTDGAGGMILLWQDGYDTKASRVDIDGVLQWAIIDVTDPANVTDNPVIAEDHSGGCYIAWSVRTGSFSDIWAQHLNADGEPLWGSFGLVVCNAPLTQSSVRIATSLNNESSEGCLFTWSDRRTGNNVSAHYAQKLDPDGSPFWQLNGVLFRDSIDQVPAVLVSDGVGGLVSVSQDAGWYSDTDPDIRAIRLNSLGQPVWDESVATVDFELVEQVIPSVLRQNDDYFITFLHGENYDQADGIRFQKLDGSTGARMFSDEGNTLIALPSSRIGGGYPVPMSDGRTGMIWTYDGPKTRYQIFNSQGQPTLNPDSAIINLDTTGVPDYLRSANANQACADGSGGFFALLASGNDEYGYDAFLAHVSSNGQVMSDGLARLIWEGADANSSASSAISADSTGGCYVVFQLWYPDYGTYLMRMNAECERMWASPVQLDTITWYQQAEDKVVTATDGSCLIAWMDVGGRYRLARTTADGSLLWNIILSDSITHWGGVHPKLVSDDQGGAYCTWIKSVDAPYYRNVYAQHVGADGTELWQHYGIPVTTRMSEQIQSRPLRDDEGNLMVVWVDDLDSDGSTIRAQKMSPQGTRLWSDSGKVVSNLPGGHLDPAVVSDGSDGLFVAWNYTGWYGAKTNVYATHLDHDGLAGSDPYWVQDAGGTISDTSAIAQTPMMIPGSDGSAVVMWVQNLLQSESEYVFESRIQRIASETLDADEKPGPIPQSFTLDQNYPNPFNPTTEITFSLSRESNASVRIYDLLGRQVTTLFDGRLSAGEHHVNFDASNLSSGVYFYRLEAHGQTAVRKMVMLK